MRLGIRATLVVGLAGLLCAAFLLAAVVILGSATAQAQRQAMHAFDQRAQLWAALAQALVESEAGFAQLDRQLHSAQADPELISAGLFDVQLHRLAGFAEGPHLGVGQALSGSASAVHMSGYDEANTLSHHYRIALPIALAGGRSGALALVFDLAPAIEAARQGQKLTLISLGLDFVLVLLFGFYGATRLFVRPVRALTEAAAQVTAGASAEQVPLLGGAREFDLLSKSLRTMVAQLQARELKLSRSLQALEQARDELVVSEKLATVGRLAAGVAHEVGNPLTSVMGYLELLREEPPPPADLQAQLLERSERELRRMGQTIRSLLDFSRVQTHSDQRIEPAALVQSALDLVRYHPRVRPLTIEREGQADAVWGDPEQLRQVLVNLLINAGQAGAQRILLRLQAAEGGALLQVLDDGPGVEAAQRGQLFEPFFTTRPAGEGTGLGLALAQRMIAQMGGRLRYCEGLPNTAGGLGAGFEIWLPEAGARV